MDITQIQQPLANYIRTLGKHIHVDDVIVFGSYCEGRADTESDIDLLIVSDSFADMNEDDRLDLLYKTSQFMQPEIHPWGYTQQELQQASRLSLLGHARDTGTKFAHTTI